MTTNQDPAFQHIGYFEDLHDIANNRCLGTRAVVDPQARKLGFAGREEFDLTETIEIDRGPKRVTIRASKARPIRVATTLQQTCGVRTFRHPLDP